MLVTETSNREEPGSSWMWPILELDFCIPVFLFFLRFYLFIHETHTHTHTEREREREREREERQRHRQREKQAPCREPNVGLDPGSPGSHPRAKAGVKPLSHPGIPCIPVFLMSNQ